MTMEFQGPATLILGGETFELKDFRTQGKDPAPSAAGVSLGVVKGQYKFALKMESTEEGRKFFDGFMAPQTRTYREQGGIVQASTGCQVGIEHPAIKPIEHAQLWQHIGTTRGDFRPTNRLRKFVVRKGRLVEVRSRGRTGFRSLQEAIADALKDGPELEIDASRLTITGQPDILMCPQNPDDSPGYDIEFVEANRGLVESIALPVISMEMKP